MTDDFELRPEFFEPKLEKDLQQLREGGENSKRLAGFFEYVRGSVETEKGVVKDLDVQGLIRGQDFYENDSLAAQFIIAFLLGAEWERADPSPENRSDVCKSDYM